MYIVNTQQYVFVKRLNDDLQGSCLPHISSPKSSVIDDGHPLGNNYPTWQIRCPTHACTPFLDVVCCCIWCIRLCFLSTFPQSTRALRIGSPLWCWVSSQKLANLSPPLSPGAQRGPFTSFICNTCYDAVQLLAPTWPRNVGWIELNLYFRGWVPPFLYSHALCTVSGPLLTGEKNLAQVQASKCCSDILPDFSWALE